MHSHIGYGSPHKHDSPEAHGEPLGVEEVRLTKQFFGFAPDKNFVVPPGRDASISPPRWGRAAQSFTPSGMRCLRVIAQNIPTWRSRSIALVSRELPEGWDSALPTFPADAKGMSTRDVSGKVLNAVADKLPWLIGGSADLTPSKKTRLTSEVGRRLPAGRHARSLSPGATCITAYANTRCAPWLTAWC